MVGSRSHDREAKRHVDGFLEVEGLDRDLAMLNLPAPTPRKHYALVPITGEGWEVGAERLRQRYAIEPLTYSPSTAQHSEVVDFLTKLIGLIRQTAAPEYFEDPK